MKSRLHLTPISPSLTLSPSLPCKSACPFVLNCADNLPSIQLNVGIIAACAPTIKPLVGHALKLSSRDKYSEDFYGGYSRETRNTRKTLRGNATVDIEMDSNRLQPKGCNTAMQAGDLATVYSKSRGDGSGSEEVILSREGGILRTTEFTVTR
jgi:hypothetical protein